MRFWPPFVITLLLISAPVRAVESEWDKYAGKFKFGVEYELTPLQLSNIIDDFDTSGVQDLITPNSELGARVLTESILWDYVQDSKALASLPEDVRTQLTAGLQLSGVSLAPAPVKTGEKQTATGIILLDSRTPPASGGLILSPHTSPPPTPSQGIIKPGPPTQVKSAVAGINVHDKNGLLVPTNHDWEVLNDRWNALPIERRRELIQFEHLSRERRANAVFGVMKVTGSNAVNPIGTALKLKPEHAEFYRSWEWVRDINVLEFRLRNPAEDPKEFLRLARDFAARGGFTAVIDRPEAVHKTRTIQVEKEVNGAIEIVDEVVNMDPSVHFHISRIEEIPGGVDPLVAALRRRLVLQNLHQGRTAIIEDVGLNNIDTKETERGPIRSVSQSRLETREHAERMEDEIRYVLARMSESPEKAIERVNQDTRLLLDKERFSQLTQLAKARAKNNSSLKYPSRVMSRFLPVLSEDQITMEILDEVKNLRVRSSLKANSTLSSAAIDRLTDRYIAHLQKIASSGSHPHPEILRLRLKALSAEKNPATMPMTLLEEVAKNGLISDVLAHLDATQAEKAKLARNYMFLEFERLNTSQGGRTFPVLVSALTLMREGLIAPKDFPEGSSFHSIQYSEVGNLLDLGFGPELAKIKDHLPPNFGTKLNEEISLRVFKPNISEETRVHLLSVQAAFSSGADCVHVLRAAIGVL